MKVTEISLSKINNRIKLPMRLQMVLTKYCCVVSLVAFSINLVVFFTIQSYNEERAATSLARQMEYVRSSMKPLEVSAYGMSWNKISEYNRNQITAKQITVKNTMSFYKGKGKENSDKLHSEHYPMTTKQWGKDLKNNSELLLNSKRSYVLIVSSFGRSGSSWISELISYQFKSFYIYEPDYYISNILGENLTYANAPTFLKSQFLCKFSTEFIDWVKTYQPKSSGVFRTEFTESICTISADCIFLANITEECNNSPIRLIKTIRVGLDIGKILFEDSNLRDLKIVFLVRDPRASLMSRKNLRWDANPEKKCNILESDLIWYEKLHSNFADRIYLLRYENMCIDPTGQATKLWQFLQEDSKATIPRKWKEFLASHSIKEIRDRSYSTMRNTAKEWNKWRKKIHNETFLIDVENNCKWSLKKLGYNSFGSLANARNMSLPVLMTDMMCPQLPCFDLS